MTEQPSWPAPGGEPPAPPGWGSPGPPPPPGYGQPHYPQPQYPPPMYGQQGFSQPYSQAAAKPGIIPLRPLAVSEVLDGAFSTIRRHPRAVLGVSAAAACLQQGLTLAARAASGTLTRGTTLHIGGSDGTRTVNASSAYGTLGTGLVISLLVSALLTGYLCLIVSDSILGQPTSAGSAWRRLRPLMWRVIGVSVAVTVLETLGLVLCVLPGIFLWGALALAIPALVLERTPAGGALRRSWRLAVPDWGRVWGIRALGALIASLLQGVAGLAIGLSTVIAVVRDADSGRAVHLSATTVVLSAVIAILVTTLTAPFQASLVTLIYVDRRIRAEALDVQLQQAALARPAGPGLTTPPGYS